MMLENTLKNNEAVSLKDEDLEQVTGGRTTVTAPAVTAGQTTTDVWERVVNTAI